MDHRCTWHSGLLWDALCCNDPLVFSLCITEIEDTVQNCAPIRLEFIFYSLSCSVILYHHKPLQWTRGKPEVKLSYCIQIKCVSFYLQMINNVYLNVLYSWTFQYFSTCCWKDWEVERWMVEITAVCKLSVPLTQPWIWCAWSWSSCQPNH